MVRRIAIVPVAIALGACAAQPPREPEVAPTPSAAASTSARASAAASPSLVEQLPRPIPHAVAATPNPELRDELLAMMAEDQAVRTGIAPPGDSRTAEELFAAWPSVDQANGERMRAILDEYGWPGWSLVGKDGALAAWVLIQHADLRPDLQEHGLALMRGAVEAGDADPGDVAYLIDRVLVAKGLPQIYGTQIGAGPDGELAPRTPIQDEANVDARRAAVGLGTLEEYYAEFRPAVEATPTPSASAP